MHLDFYIFFFQNPKKKKRKNSKCFIECVGKKIKSKTKTVMGYNRLSTWSDNKMIRILCIIPRISFQNYVNLFVRILDVNWYVLTQTKSIYFLFFSYFFGNFKWIAYVQDPARQVKKSCKVWAFPRPNVLNRLINHFHGPNLGGQDHTCVKRLTGTFYSKLPYITRVHEEQGRG